MAHLNISLLGQFKVTLEGQPVTRFRTDKTRALLSYLVVEREREHRRAMLAGLLWPDVPEASARHNLSQALLTLRRALGDKAAATPARQEPFLLPTWQTLRFNPDSDTTLDVAEFQAGCAICAGITPEHLSPDDAQRLNEAVTRYQGEFLSEPWVINSQAFEEWVLFKQTRLHLLAIEALDYLAQYHQLRGEFSLAADCARRQIVLEPLRESGHRQLMQSLALDGRRTEALAHYNQCETLLAQELGIAPASETTALMARIRADGSELSRLPATTKSGDAAALLSVPIAPPPSFVGRERELARLDAALASTLAGDGQVRFVTGEAGSGKTALLDAFARRALTAHPDVLVVKGCGNAYTGLGDPYWLFLELLRQLQGQELCSSGLTRAQIQRLDKARGAIRHTLETCSPAMAQLLAGTGAIASPPNQEQPGLFDQMARILHALASHHPLVLLLDDLQWADRDSLNLLFHLGRRLAGHRLLLLGALRLDVLDQGHTALSYLHEQERGQRHPLATLLNELQRQLGEIRIDLAQSEGQVFIEALLDSEPNHLGAEFRETLTRHTGGHALFTVELLRGMQERGELVRDARGYWVEGERIAWQTLPARVVAVIAARIDPLPPKSLALLTLASVEGAEFTVQVLAQIQGVDETEVNRLLSMPLNRQYYLVIPLGIHIVGNERLARYRFRHILFQRYLYNRLDQVERAHLHLEVGHALETLYGGQSAEISLALARHFELGGDANRAVTYLLQAGQRATHLAASEQAMRLLAHGLALLKPLALSPEREQQEAELQLALGTALLAKGWNAPERAQASTRAYELCQRIGAASQLARSLMFLADVYLAQGKLQQTLSLGAQLQILAQTTHDPFIFSLAHYVRGSAHFFGGQLLLARQHLEQAIALHGARLPSPQSVTEITLATRGRVWLVHVLWALGYVDQVVLLSQQTIAGARARGQTFLLGFALSIGEMSLRQYRREPQAMQAASREFLALGEDVSLSIYQLWDALFQGWLLAVEQRDPAGLLQIRQALDQWGDSNTPGGSAYGHALLSEAYLALGQTDAAAVAVDQMLAQCAATGFRFAEAELWRVRGETWRAYGRLDEAEACFQQAIAVAREQSAKSWELRAVLSLCRLREAEGPAPAFETAREQLVALYTWFTEGLDTPDLQEAARLL